MQQSFKEKIKWFFHVDPKDVWNYIFVIIAIMLLWWGIKQFINMGII